ARSPPAPSTLSLHDALPISPGADIAPLASHDDDGRVDLAEDVVQVLSPGRRGEDRQHGCREYHCEDLRHGNAVLEREPFDAPDDLRKEALSQPGFSRVGRERVAPRPRDTFS